MASIRDRIGQTLDFLRQRRHAYQLSFGTAKRAVRLRRAFVNAFGTPSGQMVLADLEKFCRANETCFDTDARVNAALEGRREVWLRIQQHLNLSSEDLFQLYSGRNVQSLIQRQENDQ